MSLSEIIKEIDKLPVEESLQVFSHLQNKFKKRERILESLDEIKGIGKGLWDMDAQEYINKERAGDRC
jgi:hypothetical protein